MGKLIAVVTGGTRGIGLAIAKTLANGGAAVAVTYKSNDQAGHEARQQLVKLSKSESTVLILKGDAGVSETVNEQHKIIQQELGSVNVLVNNAGIMPTRTFEEITVEEWNETIRINLNSAFYWCQKVVPDMRSQKYGRIVNISSIAARGGGVVGPHYAASKAGMVGLTRYAARELGKDGITVNAIAPAFIEDAGIFKEWSDKRKAPLNEKIYVPQLGNTQDVARAFEYLLESPFVTGVTLDVNGGAFMI